MNGASSAPATSIRAARGRRGMVVAAHGAASRAGLDMLLAGGNAMDAAVAAAFAVGVVEPYGSGIGGGGFLVLRDGATGETRCYDYRETAPAAATATMFQDAEGEPIPGSSLHGHRAAAVPGMVAGLCLAQARHGRLPLASVMEPAIRLAAEGVPANDEFCRKSQREGTLLARYPESARLFLGPGGVPRDVGDKVVQSDLAITLRAIAAEGPDAFYRGEIAERIAAEMQAGGGLITAEDLSAYRPMVRQPVCGRYRGFDVWSMPPPSSGGVHLIQILQILEGYDLARPGFGTCESLHLMAEAMRLAYADRATYLGDPGFVSVPLVALTSGSYAAALRARIRAGRATPSVEVRAGVHGQRESDCTSHVSVVDEAGTAVAMTNTLNYSFGCGVVVPVTGILLNNEMDDFSSAVGRPNLYGLTGGAENAIAPGKRPVSSMTPTIVTRDGELAAVLGSPGGSRIITIVAQVLLNLIDYRMEVGEAVNASRMHHQWLPDELRVELDGFSRNELEALKLRGHEVVEVPKWGNASAIVREPGSGILAGASDSRGGGVALGY